MTTAQIDHKPRVYKWFADSNEVEVVYLPIKQGIINRMHIENKEERDKRMDSFVSRMADDFEVGLSFEKNITEYFNINRTKKSIQDKIIQAIGE